MVKNMELNMVKPCVTRRILVHLENSIGKWSYLSPDALTKSHVGVEAVDRRVEALHGGHAPPVDQVDAADVGNVPQASEVYYNMVL